MGGWKGGLARVVGWLKKLTDTQIPQPIVRARGGEEEDVKIDD